MKIKMASGKATENSIRSSKKPVMNPAPLVEGEDYYLEGEMLIFTELYHLGRGYCCENGCRHCPYTADNLEADQTL